MGRRVYEVAKELGAESSDVLKKLRDSGEVLKDHLAQLSAEQEEKAKKLFEIQKEGEVQVKRMDGGRIVRRRVGASASAAPANAPEPPVSASGPEPAPVEVEKTEPVVEEIAAVPAVDPENVAAPAPEKVEKEETPEGPAVEVKPAEAVPKVEAAQP